MNKKRNGAKPRSVKHIHIVAGLPFLINSINAVRIKNQAK